MVGREPPYQGRETRIGGGETEAPSRIPEQQFYVVAHPLIAERFRGHTRGRQVSLQRQFDTLAKQEIRRRVEFRGAALDLIE